MTDVLADMADVIPDDLADSDYYVSLPDSPAEVPPPETMSVSAESLPMTDRWVVRIVVISLAIVTVLTLAGGFALAFDGKQIPDALIALGSAALGSLGTLLARTSTN